MIDDFYADATWLLKGKNYAGERVVIFIWPDGSRRQTTLTRFIMERKENRFLKTNERVRFKDGNPNNCAIDNLYVQKIINKPTFTPASYPASLYWKRDPVTITCVFCETEKTFTPHQLDIFLYRRRKFMQNGPFCSSKCHVNWQRAKAAGQKVKHNSFNQDLTYRQFRLEKGLAPVPTGKVVVLPADKPFNQKDRTLWES